MIFSRVRHQLAKSASPARIFSASFSTSQLPSVGRTLATCTNVFPERSVDIQTISPRSKVSIVGAAGNVGASVAYSLLHRHTPVDIKLFDINQKLLKGQSLDLADSAWLGESMVHHSSDLSEAGDSDVIVITAGAKQVPGETRAQLLDRNYKVLESILSKVQPIKKDAKILIIANPVDVLTALAQKITGLPYNQVFGSGTLLDSARLRNHLSKILNVRQRSIHCHVLGEHGDNQFVSWSTARVGGFPLDCFPEMKNIDKDGISTEIANKAYDIIDSKGATYYGVGVCGAFLIHHVLANTHDVRTISCYSKKYQSYVSLPAVVNQCGVDRVLEVDLSELEQEKMNKAVAHIKEQVGQFF
ncbi:hypothetical protein H4219_003049 [Mycoemilia scoparia]|uniref:L-lactate dehydrogenase n=1 Tax=Mycoemilia scoparia TaxID=417184 RepID=A0A9W8A1Q2_9FUNG|nr:hypothetical protein H4219_003049 [Mycoemilia scoparia]